MINTERAFKNDRIPNGAGYVRSWKKRPKETFLLGTAKAVKVKIKDIR